MNRRRTSALSAPPAALRAAVLRTHLDHKRSVVLAQLDPGAAAAEGPDAADAAEAACRQEPAAR